MLKKIGEEKRCLCRMVKVNDVYYDGWLKSNLDILKKNIKKDWDFWLLVDGREGVGKSTIAIQEAYYLDPSFTVDRVVFTPQQFSRAVDEAGKYQAIVWDESVTGTQSIDMTKMARTLKKKAVQMRQKNLFIILVIHSYFDMNKYYSVHRTWFLLHVYYVPNEETQSFTRGRFEFYDFDKKKNMYLNDKFRRFYNYGITPNFRGVFTAKMPIDREAYLEKKNKIDDGEELMEERLFVEECFKRDMTVKQVSGHVSYSDTHLWRLKKELTNNITI